MYAMESLSTFVLLFAAFLACHTSTGENVLLVPLPIFDSHWVVQAKIGQVLVDRGHVVTAVVPDDLVEKRRKERPEFRFETFHDRGTGAQLRVVEDRHCSVAGEKTSAYQLFGLFFNATANVTRHCDLLLGDDKLAGRLKASHYSVVISDPHFPCGAIIAAYIGARVPNIAVMSADPYFLDIMSTGVPMPLSYVPFISTDFTDQMTFAQRVQNVVLSTLVPMIARWVAGSTYDGLVQKYVGGEATIASVTSRTDLWLYYTDPVLHFPRPSMPNMIGVGGLNTRNVVPLSEELEAFVQSSGEDGVIVVSFGSMYKTMSPEKEKVFATALARLRQKVVWRYVGRKPVGVGNNTKVLDWLPQNDLLGHAKTRAFITHAGSKGTYEALYHGVPMVCLPLHGDQTAMATRVVVRGMGRMLDFSTVTTDQLHQAILHVLTNNSYRENAARLSSLYRDQPQSPMQRAVWWIEHVIRHGKLSHLRARAVELPFYQYHLLDVLALAAAACLVVLWTVWCSCSLICRNRTPVQSAEKIKFQ